MTEFSAEDAMAMKRRHILEGEQRIASQETLIRNLDENSPLVQEAAELLDELRDNLQVSRERPSDLEDHYPSD